MLPARGGMGNPLTYDSPRPIVGDWEASCDRRSVVGLPDAAPDPGRLPRRRRTFGELGSGTDVGIPKRFQFSPTTPEPVAASGEDLSRFACRRRTRVCETL